MPNTIVPFETKGEGGPPGSSLSEDKLNQWLPEGLREACQQHRHLRDYLRLIPIEEIGVPEYFATISRNDGGKKNVIYRVSDAVFIHIYLDPSISRGRYIPIEPSLTEDLSLVLPEVERALTRATDQLHEAESNEEKTEALIKALGNLCDIRRGPTPSKTGGKKSDKTKSRVQMTPEQFEALKYVIIRDKVGTGAIQPMLDDPNIEDISESGLGPIFVEHKIFSSLESSIIFETIADLDQFVVRMSEAIGKPVTLRNPVVDASLLDGSRINIVFGSEISRRGSSFSIRKFFDTPLSILELIGFGSISYQMAAYLSLMLENDMNIFVVGETASGKTTLMNAITTFIPLNSKIVSIEDTPELQVPHNNWVREVGKAAGAEEEGGTQVTMFDLLKAALRQRPNFIIIGEIRGAEGAIAFGAMQTGHAVMSTFHAASVEKVIQRLTGNPICIPKTYIDSLNIVVCQNAVKLPNGKLGRRATSISEIVGYDPVDDAFSFVEVFQWKQTSDEFEFVGNKNSFLLEEKIAPRYGYPPEKRWKIYTLLEKRARILERLHKEKGVTDFYELLKVLARAQHEGLF